MNAISLASFPPIDFPSVQLPERLAVIIAPQAGHSFMLDLAARLALHGPLRVLDGGNQFNAYPVARAIRHHTADLTRILQGIHMARAFTCYQMSSLIADAADEHTPTLVLDLLATFYDEDVTLAESRRLLSTCLVRLKHLAHVAPVVVGVKPPGEICQERAILVDLVRRSAAQVWEVPSSSSLTPGAEKGLF
jgi:hypothetical protein